MKILQTLTQTAKTIAEHSNGTLSVAQVKEVLSVKWKYCTGKFSTDNRGKEIKKPESYPVFYETRSDAHGSYLTLFCVLTDRLKASQERTYQEILKVWATI